MASFLRFLGSFSWRIGFCSFKQSFQISLSSQHSFVDSEPASDYHIMSTNEEASRCKLDAIKLGYWKDPFLARFVHTSMSHEKKSPISVWLLPAWLISNTFWTMSLSMSRLLTMFRNSFVMRRAGFRSREINYERSQNDWQKGKQTGLRNCALFSLPMRLGQHVQRPNQTSPVLVFDHSRLPSRLLTSCRLLPVYRLFYSKVVRYSSRRVYLIFF